MPPKSCRWVVRGLSAAGIAAVTAVPAWPVWLMLGLVLALVATVALMGTFGPRERRGDAQRVLALLLGRPPPVASHIPPAPVQIATISAKAHQPTLPEGDEP